MEILKVLKTRDIYIKSIWIYNIQTRECNVDSKKKLARSVPKHTGWSKKIYIFFTTLDLPHRKLLFKPWSLRRQC